MAARAVTTWYGVCDRCGAVDDDGRPSEDEARARMWGGPNNEDLCWECIDAEGSDG